MRVSKQREDCELALGFPLEARPGLYGSLLAFLRKFRVEFRSDQQRKGSPVQPGHEGNESSQRAVDMVEIREVGKIDAEKIRQRRSRFSSGLRSSKARRQGV